MHAASVLKAVLLLSIIVVGFSFLQRAKNTKANTESQGAELNRLRNAHQSLIREPRRVASAAQHAATPQQQAPLQRSPQPTFATALESLAQQSAVIYEHLQSSGAMIPEVALLSPSDWVALASQVGPLDSPEKMLTAVTRAQSKAKTLALQTMSAALMRAKDQNLTHISELKPYLTEALDDAVLNRYEIPPKASWDAIVRRQHPARVHQPPSAIIRERALDTLTGPRMMFYRVGNSTFIEPESSKP